MKFDPGTKRLEPGNLGQLTLLAGVLGLVMSSLGFIFQPAQFFHSYLTAFGFWVTIGLGALFFTMLHHVTGSVWSIVIRRLAETIMTILPVMFLLFLPILLGMHDLYHWSQPEAVAADRLLQWKAPYLNIGFFAVRSGIYFMIWFGLVRFLYSRSLRQDQTGDPDLSRRLRQVSAPGLILFAVTLTLAGFDWFMSLDAHWYSTIFGVYIFSGSYLAVLAFLILLLLVLRRAGILTEMVTRNHYHDLGKLLFAFTVFWAYIAGSQYFLIWYANIPEETVWFQHRWVGSWKTASLVLVLLHFAVPFSVLLFRSAKRNLAVLGSVAGLILVMHWVDLYWIVFPNLHHHGIHFSWLDLTTQIGIGGVFMGLFWKRLGGQPLVPVGDPRLPDSCYQGEE